MDILSDIIVIAIIIFSLVVSLLITVPFIGTLIRYRANYNPKGLQLDEEGGVQPHTGPIIKSYFTMMGRVWRLEVRQ